MRAADSIYSQWPIGPGPEAKRERFEELLARALAPLQPSAEAEAEPIADAPQRGPLAEALAAAVEARTRRARAAPQSDVSEPALASADPRHLAPAAQAQEAEADRNVQAAVVDGPSADAMPVAPVVTGPARRSAVFDRKAALFMVLGFVAGMLVWHLIGFWMFMSDVVLHPEPGAVAALPPPASARTPAKSAAAAQAKLAAPAPASAASLAAAKTNAPAPPAEGCMALIIDRATGLSQTGPCPADSEALRDGGRGERSAKSVTATERLATSAAWTPETAAAADGAQAAEPVAEAEASTLTPSDFTLEIRKLAD